MSEPIPLESITVRSERIGAEPDVILKGAIHTITTCWSDVREIGEQVGPNGEVLDRGGVMTHQRPSSSVVQLDGVPYAYSSAFVYRSATVRIPSRSTSWPSSSESSSASEAFSGSNRSQMHLGQLIVASIETAHRHLEPIG